MSESLPYSIASMGLDTVVSTVNYIAWQAPARLSKCGRSSKSLLSRELNANVDQRLATLVRARTELMAGRGQ
jgi:hypothetical protein